jgi:hypothetical protein
LIVGSLDVELDDSGRANKRPMERYSLDDMLGPNGEISGLYTLVVPSRRWPNATVYWEYDAELSNFSKIYSIYLGLFSEQIK